MSFNCRFKLRGPRHLIFYELPQYPHFYSEMCNLLEEPGRFSMVSKETLTCTVLYSQFDALKLRQVVGTARADHMLQADKTVHMMVSGDTT
jgi:U3 small nucleolar RNA-associated protein 25